MKPKVCEGYSHHNDLDHPNLGLFCNQLATLPMHHSHNHSFFLAEHAFILKRGVMTAVSLKGQRVLRQNETYAR